MAPQGIGIIGTIFFFGGGVILWFVDPVKADAQRKIGICAHKNRVGECDECDAAGAGLKE